MTQHTTREQQVAEMMDATAKAVCRADYPDGVYRLYIERHLVHAENRGAARVIDQIELLQTENKRLRDALSATPQPAAEQSDRKVKDSLKADMYWDAEDTENGSTDADAVMESYDPFEPVEMETGYRGPNIWGYHDSTHGFTFTSMAECHAAIDAAMGRKGRGDA